MTVRRDSGKMFPATGVPQRVVDVAMAFGLAGVLAHALNAHIIPRIDHDCDCHFAWTSIFVQEWLMRAGTVFLLPVVLASAESRARLRMEHERLRKTNLTVVTNVIGLVTVKMAISLIYMSGYRLATKHGKHLFSAFFESFIGIVYFLSIKFLDEDFSMLKVSAVMVALFGVCMTNVYDMNRALITQVTRHQDEEQEINPNLHRAVSSMLAIIAETCSCSYHIWFKSAYGCPSTEYVLLFVGLMGLCQWFIGLPLVLFLSYLGLEEAALYVSAKHWYDIMMITFAVILGNVGAIVTLIVIAGTSPLQLAAIRLLVLPTVILFEFFFAFTVPPSGSIVGCLLIITAFCMLSKSYIFPPGGRQSVRSIQSDAPQQEGSDVPLSVVKFEITEPQNIELVRIDGQSRPQIETNRNSS